ncbi:MAG: DJ-1/PfpI family protein [Pirellula sp.]|jgi:transcriptional regulator GlxA family with amidase domain|nr:DJ-1/PfpI family protein [Pirellula sp.]
MAFGVLIFDGVEELDFVGPWEMITTWADLAGGPSPCVIIAENLRPIVCANRLSVNPDVDFATCPNLEYLLIPGGRGTRREMHNEALLHFVKTQAAHCRAVVSVCTGSLVLHAAGLLADKRATTHWSTLDQLRAMGNVEVIEDRFTRDGNVWCSAGVSAGMDMILQLIADVSGAEAAGRVQFEVEYYPATTTFGNFGSHPQAPQYIRDAFRRPSCSPDQPG